MSVSSVLDRYASPIGFRTDVKVRPELGWVRRGAATELTTQSTGGKSRFSPLHDPFLGLVGECVSVEAGRMESRLFRHRLERRRVVPPRRGGPSGGGRTVEEDAEGGRAASESQGDARAQAVAGRRTEDQDRARRVGEGSGTGPAHLLRHVGGATYRMAGDADEAANSGTNDHLRKLTAGGLPKRTDRRAPRRPGKVVPSRHGNAQFRVQHLSHDRESAAGDPRNLPPRRNEHEQDAGARGRAGRRSTGIFPARHEPSLQRQPR